MFIELDFDSKIPIYEQLCNEIILAIAKGDLVANDQLPSVRSLAEDIGINLHTVRKSYNILKDQGYLSIDRRSGAKIKESFLIDKDTYIESIEKKLLYMVADGKNKGLELTDYKELFERLYKNLEG